MPWRKVGLDLPSAGERLAGSADRGPRGPWTCVSKHLQEDQAVAEHRPCWGWGSTAATADSTETAAGSGQRGCRPPAERPHPSQLVCCPVSPQQLPKPGLRRAARRALPSPPISCLEGLFPSHAFPLCPPCGAHQKCPMESVISPLPPGTQRTSSPTPAVRWGPETGFQLMDTGRSALLPWPAWSLNFHHLPRSPGH